MAVLHDQFDLVEEVISIGPHRLQVAHVRDWEALVDTVSEEAFSEDEQLPYWAEIWASAYGMAAKLGAENWEGKKTIELGAGTGLVSLTLAAAGAQPLATDLIPDALQFIEYQAQNNDLPVAVQRLDWRKLDGLPKFDSVVAADVLYEKRHLEPVLTAVQELLAPEGEAWITDPFRRTADAFAQLAVEKGFEVAVDEEVVEWKQVPTRLRHFHLKLPS